MPKQATIDCDHIYEDIYISDANTAHNLQFLKRERFTHIVNCAASLPSMHQNFFQYCRIDLDDTTNQTLISAVEKFIQFIEKPPLTVQRSQFKDPFTAPPTLSMRYTFQTPLKTPTGHSKKILVHCKQGKSRAPTVVCGYLMWKLRYTFQKALELVQKQRPKVDPNFGFLMQGSKHFEQYFFPKSPHKLLIKNAPQDPSNMDEQQENLDENAQANPNIARNQSHNFLLEIKLGTNPHSPDYQSPYHQNLIEVDKGFPVQKVFQIQRQAKQSTNKNLLNVSSSYKNQNQFTRNSSSQSKQLQFLNSQGQNHYVGHQLDLELLQNQEDYNPSFNSEEQIQQNQIQYSNRIFQQFKEQQDSYFQLQTTDIGAVQVQPQFHHFSINHQSSNHGQINIPPPAYQRNTDKDITYTNAMTNYQEQEQEQQFQKERVQNFSKFKENRLFKKIGKGN